MRKLWASCDFVITFREPAVVVRKSGKFEPRLQVRVISAAPVQNGRVTDTMLPFPWASLGLGAAPGAARSASGGAGTKRARRRSTITAGIPAHLARIVADSTDRVTWLSARRHGVTATDVARLTSVGSVAAVARDKLLGAGFAGNAFTEHGLAREPVIARWVQSEYGIRHSTSLFHATAEPQHLATPDGVLVAADGALLLAEIKTTNRPWRCIPRSYLRQVWWQQYVLGAERTLVVWEEHHEFVPVREKPRCRWVDRDENEIAQLVSLADRVLKIMNGPGRG
ncbi:MAG: YqaJ viral recombinase family protein [Microbacteriaceae bacterium]